MQHLISYFIYKVNGTEVWGGVCTLIVLKRRLSCGNDNFQNSDDIKKMITHRQRNRSRICNQHLQRPWSWKGFDLSKHKGVQCGWILVLIFLLEPFSHALSFITEISEWKPYHFDFPIFIIIIWLKYQV